MSFVRKGKMVYSCNKCSYTTNRKSNLNNHLKRKIPCSTLIDDKSNDTTICTPCDPSSNDNVKLPTSFKCSKCDKVLTSKQNLDNHEETCDGLHPLQCNICLKMFASKFGKYQHKKNVKCTPVTSQGPTHITNNNVHNDHCTNNDNSINFNFNFDTYNHDHVNVERLKEECRSLKSSLDCVVSYLKHTFFDPEHPEHRLVALKNLRSDYKFIDVFRENKWEKDTQHSVLAAILHKSLNLTSDMLKKEDPEHSVELDVDAEHNDNLKKYETNFTLDNNNYRQRASQKVKSEIYNSTMIQSVPIVEK